MNKSVQLLTFALFFNLTAILAQTLNWGNSFTPSWATTNIAGLATNVGGSSVNCNVNIGLTGGAFSFANGNSGSNSPTVTGASVIIPGSADKMQVGVNFTTNTNTCSITYTYTSLISGVSFRIADIDKHNPYNTSYLDKITVTGTNGVSTYNPVITKYDAVTDPSFLIINGNSAWVNPTSGEGDNSESNATDQRGTVTVNFGSSTINSITIVYGNQTGTHPNPSAQFIAVGNMTFSTSILPVSLTSFTGLQQRNDILLKWTTAQESGNDHFNIERNSGASWETIGVINGQGNSGVPNYYSYTDLNPAKTTLLYRLKQVDYDGHYKYSPVIRTSNKDSDIKLQTYPTLIQSQVNVAFSSPGQQIINIRLIDNSGRIINSYSKTAYKGNNNFTITGLDRFTTGVYYLQVTDEERIVLGSNRIVKE